MGGLVARQAMIRLDKYPQLFPGIDCNICGLIFLSTPHSGSGEADWNKYLTDLAELIGGLRVNAIINPLRSFNPLSARANEEFGNMKVAVPYRSFYETRKTTVAGRGRQVSSTIMFFRLCYIKN